MRTELTESQMDGLIEASQEYLDWMKDMRITMWGDPNVQKPVGILHGKDLIKKESKNENGASPSTPTRPEGN